MKLAVFLVFPLIATIFGDRGGYGPTSGTMRAYSGPSENDYFGSVKIQCTKERSTNNTGYVQRFLLK